MIHASVAEKEPFPVLFESHSSRQLRTLVITRCRCAGLKHLLVAARDDLKPCAAFSITASWLMDMRCISMLQPAAEQAKDWSKDHEHLKEGASDL